MAIKIFTSLLICFYSVFGFSQTNEFPTGKFELNIGSRPAVPYMSLQNYNADLTAFGSGPEFTVSVSRHHIIPFNVLRQFYNLVASRGRLNNLQGFFNTFSNNLHYYAGSNGVNCSRVGNDLIYAGNIGIAQGYGYATAGGSTNPLGFDTFEQYFAWLPGNLFVGPNNRSDDPHSGFESNSYVIVGADNFNILFRLYNNMVSYIDTSNDSLLNSISADLSRISVRKRIYPLNPNNWEFINGMYRIARSGKKFPEPPSNEYVVNEGNCSTMLPTFNNTLSVLSTILKDEL